MPPDENISPVELIFEDLCGIGGPELAMRIELRNNN
ncbi:hypothetical protein PI124_g21625 [Phytophthora idaei]|nr:hypothetical protein PI125_g23425 [Phytophthora idaei]KAG3128326.1 hypothetical protein PI126_g21449 [Phytophthora idaei]KAG3233297.1 hypothetical protein PI124_g21625 [Phytophthora idaei]